MTRAKAFLARGDFNGADQLEQEINEWLSADAGVRVLHLAMSTVPEGAGVPHVFVTVLYETGRGAGT